MMEALAAQLPAHLLSLAHSLSASLTRISGVRAVVIGGSWARGAGDDSSDLDLGIYYDPEQPLSLDALRALAASLDDSGSGEAVTDFGGWGPWINGGAWLTIGGQRVDWVYRDLAKVQQVFDDCISGKPATYYQPGHPHAFHTPIYMGEVALCLPLADPFGDVAALKARATPYPPTLRRAMMNSIWEAQFSLDTAHKSAARSDVLHVSGSLFRSAAVLVQVLFALNETYCINEKGALAQTERFALRPSNFASRVQRILSHVGVAAGGLEASVAMFEALVAETRALCERE